MFSKQYPIDKTQYHTPLSYFRILPCVKVSSWLTCYFSSYHVNSQKQRHTKTHTHTHTLSLQFEEL